MKGDLMKLLISAIALAFVVVAAPAAEASVCGHRMPCPRHMAYVRYHHHYAYGYPYGSYGPPPYYGAYGYAPVYGYANPGVYNSGPTYGPYPWSWGDRNTLNLLLNAEGDRPYTD
jgi:hypothetical protein